MNGQSHSQPSRHTGILLGFAAAWPVLTTTLAAQPAKWRAATQLEPFGWAGLLQLPFGAHSIGKHPDPAGQSPMGIRP